jgi:hypothetical protein
MRLEQVAKLYLQGLEYREIGRRLGCVQSQICYDLKVLKKRWSESALAATNEVRSRELAKLDRLEMEYWDAWQRSCGIKEISTTKRKTNGNGNGSRHDDKASLRKEYLLGDPRFLEGVRWCLAQRALIFGYNAPRKIALTDPSGDNEFVGISNAERLAFIVGLFEQARLRLAAAPLALPEADGDDSVH